MSTLFLAASILCLAIWLYLLLARGGFWRVERLDADRDVVPEPGNWPSVIAIVPARNEADSIARAMQSLLAQDYSGSFSIQLVDDHSGDGTAMLARQAAERHGASAHRLAILPAADLPAGWTGKLWALQQGVTYAAESRPAFYWFTDADVVHAPDTLRRLIARAEARHLDLASLMVLLQSRTVAERLLIPPFLYFFLKLYPPRWIANPRSATAGAAGGCVLLRRQALERMAGLAAIRGEVIDDCALARAVKLSGGRIRICMGLTRCSQSLRAYATFGEIRDMIARTAFTQLRYSAPRLLGALAGMLLAYLAPVALLFIGPPAARLVALTSCLVMFFTFAPTVRFYRLSPVWILSLPFAALYYSYAAWLSAARYWLGRGGQWKGRTQAPQRK